ncbi:MAG: T9SS type A sorting domain-containing protein [Bacteroidales bacterium]|nr:T9SS type A sorting domain-containing protein [Bacteroidales bacterium]
MKRVFLVLALVFVSFLARPQDTIKIMTYNLLYYNHYSQTWCTQTNNPIESKDGWLKTIIDYTLPDIVAFNEVANNSTTKYRLKGSVLNTSGRTNYMEANNPYGAGGLTSFLFYDKNKFDLVEIYNIDTDASRDFMVYRLRRKNTNPEINLYVIPAHMAAGSYSEDIAERAQMADSVINLISSRGNNDNFIFLGDLNFYTHTESGFQKLVNNSNPEYRFYDPVNQLGAWNSNYSFRNYHTQSTHTDDDGCKASGGLDDRFDIILVDDDILSGASRVKYVENSYTTIGQDGNHYNSSLIDGANTSVPANVLTALYNMSDHLPVFAKFALGETSSSATYSLSNVKINYVNPVTDQLAVQIFAPAADNYEISLMTSTGVVLEQETRWVANSDVFVFDVKMLQSGIYFLSIRNSEGRCTRKIVKL